MLGQNYRTSKLKFKITAAREQRLDVLDIGCQPIGLQSVAKPQSHKVTNRSIERLRRLIESCYETNSLAYRVPTDWVCWAVSNRTVGRERSVGQSAAWQYSTYSPLYCTELYCTRLYCTRLYCPPWVMSVFLKPLAFYYSFLIPTCQQI